MSGADGEDGAGRDGTWVAVWAGLAMVACCVGHTVVLAGGLGVLAGLTGGLTGAPVLTAVAGFAVLAALALGVRRFRAAHRHGPVRPTDNSTGTDNDPGTDTGAASCCQERTR